MSSGAEFPAFWLLLLPAENSLGLWKDLRTSWVIKRCLPEVEGPGRWNNRNEVVRIGLSLSPISIYSLAIFA